MFPCAWSLKSLNLSRKRTTALKFAMENILLSGSVALICLLTRLSPDGKSPNNRLQSNSEVPLKKWTPQSNLKEVSNAKTRLNN